MKLLEEIDPELIDQAIRRILSMRRAVDREAAIASHLKQSKELLEWVEMAAEMRLPVAARMLTMFSLGMEVGYELGQREKLREKKSA